MNQLQKLKKEIQSTLKKEKENIFEGHLDESNLKGWIEALEYCIREIELIEEGIKIDSVTGVVISDSETPDCGTINKKYLKENEK